MKHYYNYCHRYKIARNEGGYNGDNVGGGWKMRRAMQPLAVATAPLVVAADGLNYMVPKAVSSFGKNFIPDL